MPDLKSFDFVTYTIVLAIIILFNYWVFRKNIWNILDPIILFGLNVSFNLSIVAYFLIKDNVGQLTLYYIFLAWLFFIVGFKFTGKSWRAFKSKREMFARPKYFGPSKELTIYLLCILCVFQFLSVAFVLNKVGLGIIYGDVNPDILKVTISQGGNGVVRHLSVLAAFLFLPLLVHAYVVHRMKYFVFFLIVWLFVYKTFLFPTSKAGFVFMLFDLGILIYFYSFIYKVKVLTLSRVFLLAALAIVPALVVLVNVTSRYEVSIVSLLVERFIATGSGTYQFFVAGGEPILSELPFSQKFLYYFDTFLSMLKVKDWEELTYVAYMTYQLTGKYLPGFGANPYFFMDSFFLFGWFGLIYCLLLGVLLRHVRNIKGNVLSFYVSIKLVLFVVVDPAIAQANMLALLILGPPIALIYIAAKSRGERIIKLINLSGKRLGFKS